MLANICFLELKVHIHKDIKSKLLLEKRDLESLETI